MKGVGVHDHLRELIIDNKIALAVPHHKGPSLGIEFPRGAVFRCQSYVHRRKVLLDVGLPRAQVVSLVTLDGLQGLLNEKGDARCFLM